MNSLLSASRFCRDRAGAALVEFSLVLPIILVLTFGALEVGLFVFQANAAAKATQLGARWAVVNPPISTGLQAALTDTSWWAPGSLGTSCRQIACQPSAAFQCTEGVAGCNMNGIVAVMQTAYPGLKASEIVVRYEPYPAQGALGFVGRPGGVPVDVTVSLRCRTYDFPFLSVWLSWAFADVPAGCPADTKKGLPIPASTARLSSESFGTAF